MAALLHSASSPDSDWFNSSYPYSRTEAAIEQDWALYFHTDLFGDEPSTPIKPQPLSETFSALEPPSVPSWLPSDAQGIQQLQSLYQIPVSSHTQLHQNPLRLKRRSISRPSAQPGISKSPINKKQYSKSTSPSLRLRDYIYGGSVAHMAVMPQPHFATPIATTKKHVISEQYDSTTSFQQGFQTISPMQCPIMRRLSVDTRYHQPSPQTPYAAAQIFEHQIYYGNESIPTLPYLSSPPMMSSPVTAMATIEAVDRPLFSPGADLSPFLAIAMDSPVSHATVLAPMAPMTAPMTITQFATPPEPQQQVPIKLETPPKRGRGRPRKNPRSAESSPRLPKDTRPSQRRTASRSGSGSGSGSSSGPSSGSKTPKSARQAITTAPYAGISKASAGSTSTTPKTPRKSTPSSGGGTTRRSSSSATNNNNNGANGMTGGLSFVNYTTSDKRKLLTGVAPSGSSKTKAKREREAAEQKQDEIVNMMMKAADMTLREERARIGLGIGVGVGFGALVGTQEGTAKVLGGEDVMWGSWTGG